MKHNRDTSLKEGVILESRLYTVYTAVASCALAGVILDDILMSLSLFA